jgi:hypothetical protein
MLHAYLCILPMAAIFSVVAEYFIDRNALLIWDFADR